MVQPGVLFCAQTFQGRRVEPIAWRLSRGLNPLDSQGAGPHSLIPALCNQMRHALGLLFVCQMAQAF